MPPQIIFLAFFTFFCFFFDYFIKKLLLCSMNYLTKVELKKPKNMKNVFRFTLVALIAVAISACGGSKGDTPEAVAEQFAKALNDKKFDAAKKLGTEATGQMLDMIASMSALGGDDGEKVKEFKDFKAEVNGEAAKVTYLADGKTEMLDLVKKGDKWLVDMKKEGPDMGDLGEGFDSMMEDLEGLGEEMEEGEEEVVEAQ